MHQKKSGPLSVFAYRKQASRPEAASPIQLGVSALKDIRPAQGPHAQAPTSSADVHIDTPEAVEDLVHGEAGQHGLKTLVPLDAEDDSKPLFAETVGKEAVIADLLESGREDVHHEPADELTAGKGHLFEGRIVPVVLCPKSDGVRRDRLHPGVGDGDAVGIAPQVLDGIAEAVKGLPDVWAPGSIVEPVPQGGPGSGGHQGGAGSRERKLPAFMKGVEGGKELSPELSGKDPGGDEEAAATGPKLPVPGEPAAGDDAVDVGMEVELLPPGMEDLDDARGGTQEPPVSGELQQGLCGAPVEEGVEECLVCIDQGVKLCGDGEDHMEIGGINDLRLAGVDPELFQKGLAAGAVTVAAGIVVEVHVAAVRADGDVAAQLSGLAVHDGGGGLFLHVGRTERSGIPFPGIVKDLLDLKPAHAASLPSGQRD